MRKLLLALLTLLAIGSAVLVSQSGSAPPPPSDASAPWQAIGAVQPRLSLPGDAIVFSYQGAIWRMAGTGGTMRRLTDGEGFDIEPAWSPDAKQVAYVNSPNFAGGELRLIDAEEGSALALPASVRARGKLHFHADGGKLLGNFQPAGQPEALAWFDLETGKTAPLLDPPRAVMSPSLSHDGKTIAFVTTQDVAGEQTGNDGPEADVWTVPASGGQPQKLSRFPARIYDLCWAHDDRALYVVTDLGEVHNDLWELPADTTNLPPRKLTFIQGDEDRPSVSRDGRWLLFTDNHRGATALVMRDLAADSDRILRVQQLNFGKPAGRLHLSLKQKDADSPPVARVSIRHEGGKFHAPPGALYRILGNQMHFYCRERDELALPAGRYQLRAARGPEYRPLLQEFEIQPGRTTDLALELERWTDAASRGWFSGENHIHANYGYGEWYNTPQTMLLQCEGEDLNVCNFMVANSDGDGVFDREFFRGRPDVLSTPRTILYWNQEFRSTIWGHMTLVNLRQVVEPVFTGFKDTTNPWDVPTNADIGDRTRLQKGLVNYTHPAQNAEDPYLGAYSGKGVPMDVALGKIDSFDLNLTYAGSVPLWYRLLNCGFRLPASAGTDCFLNRIRSALPGGDRAYVKIDGPFSYEAWIEGLRAGRSFVTNGPMLELTAEGKGLGTVIQLPSAREIRVTAKASSHFPLERVELVSNGRVVAAGKLSETKQEGTIDQTVLVDQSGWIALRASGPSHPDRAGGGPYAHTSPIYVVVSGKPAASPTDAQFFLAWIDRLEAAVRGRDRLPTAELKAHVTSQLEAARTVYRRMTPAGQ